MQNPELAPNTPVIGTNGNVFTGPVFRIRSANGMVLDDWGGQATGQGTLSQMKDDGNHKNRLWQLVYIEDKFYRIRSFNGVCIDDWGGAYVGNGTASQVRDDGSHGNRAWRFIPTYGNFYIITGWFEKVQLDDEGGSISGYGTASFSRGGTGIQKNISW